MSPKQIRLSPSSGGRRPLSPLGPTLLAAGAAAVLAGIRSMRARSHRRKAASHAAAGRRAGR